MSARPGRRPPGPLWHAAYEKLCSAYVSHLQSGGDAASQQIVRIRQYIDEHIEEELSLKRVAQAFYLSTSYLSRLFKNKAVLLPNAPSNAGRPTRVRFPRRITRTPRLSPSSAR